MARPKKQTVDYFPHSCIHGTTIFVLEQRFGNDGYAFWFKLLEELGRTEQHFLDLNKISTLNYLSAKCNIDTIKCREILSLLAEQDAIDGDLWAGQIVWSQKFVDGISDVYSRFRHTLPPQRPNIYADKHSVKGVSTQIYPQSKVKESKVYICPSAFLSFYEKYPKKIAKPKALQAWLKLSPANGTVEAIMSGLEKWKLSPDWTKDNGQFIPHPATWLNQRRWEDEIPEPPKKWNEE